MKTVRAFSLVEILVVTALIGFMVVMAMPALSSLLKSSELQRGGGIVADAVTSARQIATSQHAAAELRFVELDGDGGKRWQAVQVWGANPRGGLMEPLSKLVRLPEVIAIAPTLSPILQNGDAQGTINLPAGGGSCNYAGVRFRPDGSLEHPIGSSENFVTLLDARFVDTNAPPANLLTVQINAFTGIPTIYQP